ncbi:MAG TPA: DUF2007 domain-containing protein [Acidimicrobiales bacterium]
MTIGPMVPLTTVADPFSARVLAAHLGAEGIVWELRGGVDGPYPVGPVQVLVAEDQLALAREVVGEHHADAAAAAGTGDHRAPRELWLVVAVILIAAAVLLGRLVTLTWT